ncbi:MAG: ABC transporter ATP-binding protein [Promethearchaeota archaeon]
MTYIICKDLKKEYEIGEYIIIALDDVNIEIDKNEFITIQGVSGAGKTTLLNILGSLEKPTSGKVIIEDTEISVMSEASLSPWRAINIGFIFQSFNLIETLTAKENIALPALLLNKNAERVEKRVLELMELVDMTDRMDHLPAQLSAGEQQRVAIARALINNPPIIIADEPTANLDDKNAITIRNLFSEIKEMDEKTVVIATHDKEIIKLASRKFVIDAGKVSEL